MSLDQLRVLAQLRGVAYTDETTSEDLLQSLIDNERRPVPLAPHPKPLFKVCLMGDGKVGKTMLAHLLSGLPPPDEYVPTIGCVVRDIETEKYRIKLWDIAGVEENAGLRDGYFIGAQLGVIVFDYNDPTTIKNVARWRLWFTQATDFKNPIVLLGNHVNNTFRNRRSTMMHIRAEQWGDTLINTASLEEGVDRLKQTIEERLTLAWEQGKIEPQVEREDTELKVITIRHVC